MKRLIIHLGFISVGVLLLMVVGCAAGGRVERDNSTGDVEVGSSTPLVLSSSKTANASLSSGPISLEFAFSEPLAVPPTITYGALTEGDLAASVVKAAETGTCTLSDDGTTALCELTVAGCNTLTDYLVTLSNAENANGDPMRSYELILNSADTEANDAQELNVCWNEFVDEDGFGDPVPLEEYALVELVDGNLRWIIVQPPGDLVRANLYKDFTGYTNVAVTMKAGAGEVLSETGGNMVGVQFSLAAEPESLSSAYHMIAEGVVATTYSDDATGAFYIPDFFEAFSGEPDHYYCIVKNMEAFSYFLSTDGINFTQLTSENTDLYFSGTGCTITPIEAGIECPESAADVCMEDGEYGTEDCPVASYEECITAIEGMFTEEVCGGGDIAGALGVEYLYPIVRIFGWSQRASLSLPLIDFVRFRSVDIIGDASDCPRVY